jgi:hypothetical protein
MKILTRLLLGLVVLYGLGAIAYGLFHYSSEDRPDVGTILADFHRDIGDLFRSKPSSNPSPAARRPEGPSSLDRLRVDAGLDLDLSLALSEVVVPGTSAHLQARAAETWDALRPIHAEVLPRAIDDLAGLRSLKRSDPKAFERERDAARARLLPARATLKKYAEAEDAPGGAVTLLEVLEKVDARLAGL